MRRSRKKRLGLATLVLALATALASVSVASAVKQGPPKPKGVNKVKQVNGQINPANPGPPYTSSRLTSTITVPNKDQFNWLIRDVNIDLHLVAPPGTDTDALRIFVKGPNGATVPLVSFAGSVDGVGFGTSCNGGAMLFDDQATELFMSDDAFDPATADPNEQEFTIYPPYPGKVQPDGTLRAFNGFKVKGNWTLYVFNYDDVGFTGLSLVCWSLHAKPQKVAKHQHKQNDIL